MPLPVAPPIQKPPLGTQINWGHPLAKGLVLCSLFNEGGGQNITNLVHNTPDGVLNTGTRIISQRGLAGNWSGANGVYGYFAHATPFIVTGALSVVCLFRYNAVADYKFLMSKESASGYAGALPNIYTHSTQALRFVRGNSVNSEGGVTGNAVPVAGTWYQGIFTSVAGGAYTIYLNGVYDNTANYATTPADSGTQFRLGNRNYATDIFGANCTIPYLYIYNRVITRNEISWLYAEPYCFMQPITRRYL